ncbi:site-specific DNA-methyltransferase [Blastopirellula sp. J2-11]|uniref:site-specific DNA-methyltransferase n=1 Tax=Blastopirellula sp. J2-11 TaxID=2943192 RepID=UPI0021C83189|nr:site-specific DNA-methyltransferase [Blastopirellula sp. J2-11]UUO05001.1 site-specific DNA-methyltransferase [Blastopirellula sp. J2-11]
MILTTDPQTLAPQSVPTPNNSEQNFTPKPKFIELPVAPRNASPVPELTSIHSVKGRGPYGNCRYRGNCGGHIIRDLLRYFQPKSVLDPMMGSGTCRDVCRELGIPCHSMDVRKGQDAADRASYADCEPVDFVWMHPPYWRMIRYNDDPRCLSNAPSLDDFLDRMELVLRNCQGVLRPRGKIAVLIGGYSDRGRYQPLPHLLVARAIQVGLWPACTEIIRFQHGNTSSRKTYQSSFIPRLHDVCLVFERV